MIENTDGRAPILRGEALQKTYMKNGRNVHPLNLIDFCLYSGEILGVVGESGSGKSTLLKVISGIEKPDAGHLFHQEKEYTGAGPAQTGRFLQMIFQDAYGSFDPRMTMRRSLKEASGYSESRLSDILSKVGLDTGLLDRKPGSLSGGQCQRMSIARALLSDVGILLCDEITSALDVTTQAQVVRLIEDLRKTSDLSIIFVSHDIALVSNLCDRVMVLKDGVCVEDGDTKTVIKAPKHEYTRELVKGVISVV